MKSDDELVSPQDDLTETCDQLVKEESKNEHAVTTKAPVSPPASSNILNEPVSPHEYYQLQHRKSIHEPELQNSQSKVTNSSGEDVTYFKQNIVFSPSKGNANSAVTQGLVSEAFRK